MLKLPVQLTPELEKPEIKITTNWRAAAPQEVEAEIVEPQEKVLRGIPGASRILARAQRGRAEITITFEVGKELQRALIEVLNRLNQVPRYPEDTDEPVISAVGGDSRAIAWFNIQTLPGNDRPIASYKDFLEEVVQSRIEQVPGVALSEIYGGRDTEIRITFGPYLAANLGVQLPVVSRLAGGNQDVTGGFTEVGKRLYTLRFKGRLNAEQLPNLIVEWRDGRPVHLRNIATVDVVLSDRSAFGIGNDNSAMYANAHREQGVNVLQVMNKLQQAIEELKQGPLKRAGLNINQVYDETVYINRSIEMLRTNLGLGICGQADRDSARYGGQFCSGYRHSLLVDERPVSLFHRQPYDTAGNSYGQRRWNFRIALDQRAQSTTAGFAYHDRICHLFGFSGE